jgi:hypothetical protein
VDLEVQIRPSDLVQDPLVFFDGIVEAHGFVTDVRGRVARRFSARFHGVTGSGGIAINEVLRYADGQVDRRQWHIRADGDGRWLGEANDVATPIQIRRISPTETRWTYAMDVPVGGKPMRLAFEDVMVQMHPDTLISTTPVRKFGLTVARVTCSYQRVG